MQVMDPFNPGFKWGCLQMNKPSITLAVGGKSLLKSSTLPSVILPALSRGISVFLL